MKYCKKCDTTFNDDFLFCPKCGSRLLSEAEVRSMNAQIDAEINAKKEEEKNIKIAQQNAEKYLKFLSSHSKEVLALFGEYKAPSQGIVEYIAKGDVHYYQRLLPKGEYYEIYDILVGHKEHTARSMYDELDKRYNEIHEKWGEVFYNIYSSGGVGKEEVKKTYYFEIENALLSGGYFKHIVHIDKRTDKRNFRSHKDMWDMTVTTCDYFNIYKYSIVEYKVGIDTLLQRAKNKVLYGSEETCGLYYYVLKQELKFIENMYDDYALEVHRIIVDEKRKTNPRPSIAVNNFLTDENGFKRYCDRISRIINLLETLGEIKVYKSEYYETIERYSHKGNAYDL